MAIKKQPFNYGQYAKQAQVKGQWGVPDPAGTARGRLAQFRRGLTGIGVARNKFERWAMLSKPGEEASGISAGIGAEQDRMMAQRQKISERATRQQIHRSQQPDTYTYKTGEMVYNPDKGYKEYKETYKTGSRSEDIEARRVGAYTAFGKDTGWDADVMYDYQHQRGKHYEQSMTQLFMSNPEDAAKTMEWLYDWFDDFDKTLWTMAIFNGMNKFGDVSSLEGVTYFQGDDPAAPNYDPRQAGLPVLKTDEQRGAYAVSLAAARSDKMNNAVEKFGELKAKMFTLQWAKSQDVEGWDSVGELLTVRKSPEAKKLVGTLRNYTKLLLQSYSIPNDIIDLAINPACPLDIDVLARIPGIGIKLNTLLTPLTAAVFNYICGDDELIRVVYDESTDRYRTQKIKVPTTEDANVPSATIASQMEGTYWDVSGLWTGEESLDFDFGGVGDEADQPETEYNEISLSGGTQTELVPHGDEQVYPSSGATPSKVPESEIQALLDEMRETYPEAMGYLPDWLLNNFLSTLHGGYGTGANSEVWDTIKYGVMEKGPSFLSEFLRLFQEEIDKQGISKVIAVSLGDILNNPFGSDKPQELAESRAEQAAQDRAAGIAMDVLERMDLESAQPAITPSATTTITPATSAVQGSAESTTQFIDGEVWHTDPSLPEGYLVHDLVGDEGRARNWSVDQVLSTFEMQSYFDGYEDLPADATFVVRKDGDSYQIVSQTISGRTFNYSGEELSSVIDPDGNELTPEEYEAMVADAGNFISAGKFALGGEFGDFFEWLISDRRYVDEDGVFIGPIMGVPGQEYVVKTPEGLAEFVTKEFDTTLRILYENQDKPGVLSVLEYIVGEDNPEKYRAIFQSFADWNNNAISRATLGLGMLDTSDIALGLYESPSLDYFNFAMQGNTGIILDPVEAWGMTVYRQNGYSPEYCIKNRELIADYAYTKLLEWGGYREGEELFNYLANHVISFQKKEVVGVPDVEQIGDIGDGLSYRTYNDDGTARRLYTYTPTHQAEPSALTGWMPTFEKLDDFYDYIAGEQGVEWIANNGLSLESYMFLENIGLTPGQIFDIFTDKYEEPGVYHGRDVEDTGYNIDVWGALVNVFRASEEFSVNAWNQIDMALHPDALNTKAYNEAVTQLAIDKYGGGTANEDRFGLYLAMFTGFLDPDLAAITNTYAADWVKEAGTWTNPVFLLPVGPAVRGLKSFAARSLARTATESLSAKLITVNIPKVFERTLLRRTTAPFIQKLTKGRINLLRDPGESLIKWGEKVGIKITRVPKTQWLQSYTELQAASRGEPLLTRAMSAGGFIVNSAAGRFYVHNLREAVNYLKSIKKPLSEGAMREQASRLGAVVKKGGYPIEQEFPLLLAGDQYTTRLSVRVAKKLAREVGATITPATDGYIIEFGDKVIRANSLIEATFYLKYGSVDSLGLLQSGLHLIEKVPMTHLDGTPFLDKARNPITTIVYDVQKYEGLLSTQRWFNKIVKRSQYYKEGDIDAIFMAIKDSLTKGELNPTKVLSFAAKANRTIIEAGIRASSQFMSVLERECGYPFARNPASELGEKLLVKGRNVLAGESKEVKRLYDKDGIFVQGIDKKITEAKFAEAEAKGITLPRRSATGEISYATGDVAQYWRYYGFKHEGAAEFLMNFEKMEDALRKLAVSHGVDIGYVSFKDVAAIAHFFPRQAVGIKEFEAIKMAHYDPTKKRVYDFMIEGMDDGIKYGTLFDSMQSYIKSIYRSIGREYEKKIVNAVRTAPASLTAQGKMLVANLADAKKYYEQSDRLLQIVNDFKDVPSFTRKTKSFMTRQFPEVYEEIKNITRLKTQVADTERLSSIVERLQRMPEKGALSAEDKQFLRIWYKKYVKDPQMKGKYVKEAYKNMGDVTPEQIFIDIFEKQDIFKRTQVRELAENLQKLYNEVNLFYEKLLQNPGDFMYNPAKEAIPDLLTFEKMFRQKIEQIVVHGKPYQEVFADIPKKLKYPYKDLLDALKKYEKFVKAGRAKGEVGVEGLPPVAPKAGIEAPVAGGVKEPWQMTKAEYAKSTGVERGAKERRYIELEKEIADARANKNYDLARQLNKERDDLYDSIRFGATGHEHKVAVERAIARGESIPAEVLAEYPHLTVAPKAGGGTPFVHYSQVKGEVGVEGVYRNADEFASQNKPTLNVGMNVKGELKLTPQKITKVLKDEFGVGVENYKVVQSGTEPTFVPELTRPLTNKELYKLSELLEQEAIAAHTGSKGMIAGPKAASWGGKFNPDFYLNQEGRTFSELADVWNQGITGGTSYTHFSRVAGLKELEPRFGEGVAAGEAKRKAAYPEYWVDRINVYTKQVPSEARITDLPHKYTGTIEGKLLDSAGTEYTALRKEAAALIEKDRLIPTPEAVTTLTEKLAKERGFTGIEYQKGTIVFGKLPVGPRTPTAGSKTLRMQEAQLENIDNFAREYLTRTFHGLEKFKYELTEEAQTKLNDLLETVKNAQAEAKAVYKMDKAARAEYFKRVNSADYILGQASVDIPRYRNWVFNAVVVKERALTPAAIRDVGLRAALKTDIGFKKSLGFIRLKEKVYAGDELARIIEHTLELEVNAWLKFMYKFTRFQVTGMTVMDFSAPLTFGQLLMSNPLHFTKAAGLSFMTMIHPRMLAMFRVAHRGTYDKMIQAGMKTASDFEDMYAGLGVARSAVARMPILKDYEAALLAPMSRSSLAFSSFTEYGRVFLAESMESSWLAAGGTRAGLAEFVNLATCQLPDMARPASRNVLMAEGALAFAPNYLRAHALLLYRLGGNGIMGSELRKLIIKHWAAWEAIYLGFWFGLECEGTPHVLPWDPHYLQFEKDGQTYGLGGFLPGLSRTMAKILAIATDNPGKLISFDADTWQQTVREWDDLFAPAWRYAGYKMAPGFNFVREMVTGRDIFGRRLEDKEDYMEAVMSSWMPMLASNLMYSEAPLTPLSFMVNALALQNYPASAATRLRDYAQEYLKTVDPTLLPDYLAEKQMDGTLTWDDLGYVLQKIFLEKDETLNELYEESREASKAWQTGGYLKYMDAREEMQETFIQYTTDEYLRLQRGEITIKQYWDAITKMRSDQFQQKVGLLAGYPELKEYFDSLEADDDPAVLDEAYDAYCDAMWGDDVMTPEGDIDFEKQKEKLEEWRDTWDPTGANRIEDYITQLRSITYADSPELAVRFWDLTQQLDEYYAVPPNERAKWRSRPENADIEAILVFTGRVSTIQNPDVEEVIRGWAEEMGIDPDKTIPALINLMIPQDMMDKYSMTNPNHLRELNALPTEGYERRRYMIEHPEFMNYMIAENGISRYDQYGNDRFSWDTVPTVEQETMIRAYEGIPSSQTTLRKAWRCRNQAGEQALIKFGFVSSAIHGSPQCELILSGSVEEVFSSMTSDAW